MSKLHISNNLIQIAESVLSKKRTLADLRTEIDEISSEVRKPPVGGLTGDTSGHFYIEAPWTCEDCPQNLTVNMHHPRAKRIFGGKHMIEYWSERGELCSVTTLPERCRDCDTRYRKHKRTTKAIRAVFYHPNRMYKPEDENVWCFVPTKKGRQYRHIKLITLEHQTHLLDFQKAPEDPLDRTAFLTDFACTAGEELKEKFRRKRKLRWWKDHALYGRWFYEVTWRVHYADGSTFPKGPKGTQWMPEGKELEGAESISIHPHLHVVMCSKFMDKDELTDWWDYGTYIKSTDRWMVCKDYLTKYVNKQQLKGRHQGTFGSLKKQ